MKRQSMLVLLAVLFIAPASVVCAAEELDEKMSKNDKADYYQPHRDAGHEAMNAGNFVEAIPHLKKAADNTAFTYVRAIQTSNVAFCYLNNAEIVKSKSDAKDALKNYKTALALMDDADEICGDGCVHEADGVTNCTSLRETFRGIIERGVRNAKKFLGL